MKSSWRTEGGDRRGGGERELNQILLQELAYIPSSIPKAKTLEEGDEHTNEQCKNDPLKVTNVAEKEWDQLDTRLARYDRNRERTLSWRSQSHIVYDFQTKSDRRSQELIFLPKIRPFLSKLDSWAIVLQIEWNLDTTVTSTPETSSQKRFFPSPKIPLSILDELEELDFGKTGRNPRDSWARAMDSLQGWR
jgi:hypothetical protein